MHAALRLTGLSPWSPLAFLVCCSQVVVQLLSPDGSCGLGVHDGALPWLAVGAGGWEVSWAAAWSTGTLCLWLGLLIHGGAQDTWRPGRGSCKLPSDLTSGIPAHQFCCILVVQGVPKACQPRGELGSRIRCVPGGRVSVSAHYGGAGRMDGVGVVKRSLPQEAEWKQTPPRK